MGSEDKRATGVRNGERLTDAYLEIARRVRRDGFNRSPDSDDILQDACVRMLQLEQPAAVQTPVGYLLRVARNLLIDRQRSKIRENNLFDRSADADTLIESAKATSSYDSRDPERLLIAKQRLGIALATIETLPPRCREAFKLRRIEGLSYTAIARQMGISTSTVEKYMAQALLKLSRTLSGDTVND